MNNKSIVAVIMIAIIVGILLCVFLVCLAGGGLIALGLTNVPTPTPDFPIEVNREPVSLGAMETLQSLKDALVPENDLTDLAGRFEGKTDIPLTLDTPPIAYQIGDTTQFYATNTDTNDIFQISVNLEYMTDHAYFWIEDGIDFDPQDLQTLAETFEEHIYRTDRQFFGSEWIPGIDNDPRIYIVFARNLGFSLAGYFSSIDSVNPLAHEYSNAHEMLFMNADNLTLRDEFTYSVLAHEFQHMIHWYHDRNETSWLNEGFAELAAFINGYGVGGFDYYFIGNPDTQLNDWPNDASATPGHYGAGFLFVTYFLDRFGEDATKAIVAEPENGLESIGKVMMDFGLKDETTLSPIAVDDVFRDWTVTNFLLDGSIADGRYTYHNYPDAPQAYETETLTDCSGTPQAREVDQYGTDYIHIECGGSFTLTFEGSSEVNLIPEDAHSGDFAFWSNKGDESDMTLTHSVDLTSVVGPVSLSYWTWYDLEKDYDFVYVEVSEDGQSWTILTTPSCATENKSGNSYGCGYNGNSTGWIQEGVDLSEYVGRNILLRFEYITDAAVNGEGFFLDDLSISGIGYNTDFEFLDEAWISEGFVRIQNRLPQTFLLTLIQKGANTTVENLTLNSDQSLRMYIDAGTDVDEIILVVSGNTRFTRTPASYQVILEP
jgi:immune inhibitor A